MRIGNCCGGERVELQGLKAREKGEPAHADFRVLLDEELSNSSTTETDASSELESSGGVSALKGLFPLRTIQTNGVDSSVLEGVGHVEMILDDISTNLSNGGGTPREMEGVVMSLGDASEKLGNSLEGISNDHPLNQVGQGLSVLAYVESIKWRRGDYVE